MRRCTTLAAVAAMALIGAAVFGGHHADDFVALQSDMARDENKKVEFRASGLEVQADRMVLQALKDPVMHMLRNSISHGMETAEERKRAGKPELGGITLPRGELNGRIDEVLAQFPRIKERINNQASTMSGGEQKQLEVGRALLLRPRVLLIDEPSIGLSPKLVQDVMSLLRKLADNGTTILMVEQNVRTALKYSNRALVLEMGRLALDRPASELLDDPNLNRLFLGGHAPTKETAGAGASV